MNDCSCNNKNHNDSCQDGCGCGHHHDNHQLTLTLEDGSEKICDVLATFELEEKNYIVLLAQGEELAYIFIFNEDENGDISLDNIESDDEFEKVHDEYRRLFLEE